MAKLLAPNGKPSNLSPEQYKLVRSESFKAWFGDWENDPLNSSKVIDEETKEPLLVYHGTNEEFNVFSKKGKGNRVLGYFFTTDKEFIKNYGESKLYFLNIKNIKNFNSEKFDSLNTRENAENNYWQLEKDKLLEENYNGVIIDRNDFFAGINFVRKDYVAFEPNQIKLADGTNTTFDSNNPDIRFDNGGSILLAPNGKPSNLSPEQYELVRTPAFKEFFGDWENLILTKLNDSGIDEVSLKRLEDNVSKVVDSNGEPLVVYRGNREQIGYEFTLGHNLLKKPTINNFGHFFTPNIWVAKRYAEDFMQTDKGYILEVFLNAKNILDLTELGNDSSGEVFVDYLKSKKIQFGDYEELINEVRKYEGNYDEIDKTYYSPTIYGFFDYYPKLRDFFIDNNINGIKFLERSRGGGLTYVVFQSEQIKLADGINTTFDGNNPDIRFDNGGNLEDDYYDENEIYWTNNYLVHYLFSQMDNEFKHLEEKNLILSNDEKIVFREYNNEGIIRMKPLGLWYAKGFEWVEWILYQMPHWSNDYHYLHEIKTTDKVLKINNNVDAIKFSVEYGVYEKNSFDITEYTRIDQIDWHKVAKKWSGIEMVNPRANFDYINDRRLLWTGFWDISSGCIWKADGFSEINLLIDYKDYNNPDIRFEEGGELYSEISKEINEVNALSDKDLTPMQLQYLNKKLLFFTSDKMNTLREINQNLWQDLRRKQRKVEDILKEKETKKGVAGYLNEKYMYHFTTIFNLTDIVESKSIGNWQELGHIISLTTNPIFGEVEVSGVKSWNQGMEIKKAILFSDLSVKIVFDLQKIKADGIKITKGSGKTGTHFGEYELIIPQFNEKDKWWKYVSWIEIDKNKKEIKEMLDYKWVKERNIKDVMQVPIDIWIKGKQAESTLGVELKKLGIEVREREKIDVEKYLFGDKKPKYADGGLIAPNGKRSYLTPIQYELVRRPEFKAWFGDWENSPETSSKVVGSNGEPLPVYHGTNAEPFVVFDGGSFFTDDYMNADGYASGEMVYEVFLNIKKPLIINARGRKWDNLKNKYGNSTRDIVGQLDMDKYDGVIFNNINDNWFDDEMGDTQNVYFSINPEQIKLADGSNDTFDGNNSDIRYNNGGELNNQIEKIAKQVVLDLGEKFSENEFVGKCKEISEEIALRLNKIKIEAIPMRIIDGEDKKYNSPVFNHAYTFLPKTNQIIDTQIWQLEGQPDNLETRKVLFNWDYYNNLIELYEVEPISDWENRFSDGGEIIINPTEIECHTCHWKWKVKDGGDDLFICHKCYTDNTKYYKFEGLKGEKILDTITYEKGGEIDDKVGKEFWFEYHCFESPISCDAEIWYRSHQKVKVIKVVEWSYIDATKEERLKDGNPRVYLVEWKDGFQYDVFEDELMDSSDEFHRPDPPKRMKKGGRTIAQTPAPKKDQIKGSDKNKEGSAKDLTSAKKIKFADDVLEKIQNSVDKHNKKHSNKKITIDSAKAVVRRGMGAYSSTHRPTISGGNENSRVAWGLARLNAFMYKIVNGKSKSGKYSQDNDLIEELGYKVEKYEIGGIFQGTPYDFNAYSTEYMGTGEGNQVFGWGLYFTDQKKIAERYAYMPNENSFYIKGISLKNSKQFTQEEKDIILNIWRELWEMGYSETSSDYLFEILNEISQKSILLDIEDESVFDKETILELNENAKLYNALNDKLKNSDLEIKSNVVNVTLFKGKNPKDYDLMSWNDSLEQNQYAKILIESKKIGGIDLQEDWEIDNDLIIDSNALIPIAGNTIYDWLSATLGSDKQASLFLLGAGIDGIKYKSGTLSGMEDKEGYNYVIFDGDDVTIESKEKYADGGDIQAYEDAMGISEFKEGGEAKPKKVYLSIPIESEYKDILNEKGLDDGSKLRNYQEKTFEDLQSGKLVGVIGVSSSPHNVGEWFYHRNCLIVMKYDEFVKLNDFTIIDYDNPEQLMADDMKLLNRLYQNKRDENTDEETLKAQRRNILQNVLGKFKQPFDIANKKEPNLSKKQGLYRIEHFLEESYKFINWIVNNNNILNSSDDLAEKIIEYHYSDDSNYISTFYGNTEDKNIDKKYILPFVIEMIKSAGNVFKSEQEIYLNNKILNIPNDSQLFFKNEKERKSNLLELIDKYKLREKYSVYFVKHQDIQKYSSLASQKRNNIAQEKFNSDRKELEIKKDAVVHELLYFFLGQSLKSFKEIIEKEIAEYSDSTLFYYDYDEERKEIDWYGIILVQAIINKYIEIIQNNWKQFISTKDVKDITIHSFYDFQNNSNRELIKYFEENKLELEKINDYHNINGNWLSEYRIEYWLKKSVDDYQDMPEWIDHKELAKMYLEKMDAQMYRYYSEQEIPLFSKYNEGGSVSGSVKLINERVKCINENLKNKLSEYENQNQYDDLWFEIRMLSRKLDDFIESGKFKMSNDEFQLLKNSFYPLDADENKYKKGEEVTQQFPNLRKLNMKIWRATGDAVLYRGVSVEDWERIQNQGYIDSDMRSAITEYEGINLGQSVSTASTYLPRNKDGVILAINPKGLDMYILTDGYIRLFEPIPIENVIKVSDVLSKDKLGTILSPNTNEKLNEIEDWLKQNSIQVKCNDDITLKNGGNVMLAPNGKPSNLSPEQYKLVRTPAFKEFFGDWQNDPANASKVVDENGEPKVMYHSSDSEFTIFNPEQKSRWTNQRKEKAIWFGGNNKVSSYTNNGYLYEVFLCSFNPIIVDAKDYDSWNYYYDENNNKTYDIGRIKGRFITQAKEVKWDGTAKNNDGILFLNAWDNVPLGVVCLVFEPEQIKLADGTNTTFDINNPDIRFDNGGEADEPNEFWGTEAGGVLVYCSTTERYLILLRSEWVLEPNTWGIISGKLDDDETNIEDAVLRESEEETGHKLGDLIPSFIFEKPNFKFHNFVSIIEKEFVPELNWENTDYKWVKLNEMPDNLHFGLKLLLQKEDMQTLVKKNKNNAMNKYNPKDEVTFNIPLLIRFAELMREEIKTDVALHEVIENLIDIKDKGTLTMRDYDSMVGNVTGSEENKPEVEKMEQGGSLDKRIEEYFNKPHNLGYAQLNLPFNIVVNDIDCVNKIKEKYNKIEVIKIANPRVKQPISYYLFIRNWSGISQLKKILSECYNHSTEYGFISEQQIEAYKTMSEKEFEEGGKVNSIKSKKGDIKISLDENWYSDDTKVELVPVSELMKFREFDRKVKPKYNQDNSRDNINHLKFMFEKNGVQEPLIIEYSAQDNAVLVIEGNHRINSAIDLGMEYLPARVVLKKYSKFTPNQLKNSMKVEGIKANSSNYIPSDLKASQIGITGAKPIYADGGIIEGRLHSECGDDGCGRKFQVGEDGHIIEAERDEAVIVANAFESNEELTIKGTLSEVASALNVVGGGKNFDKGATIIKNGSQLEIPELKKQATNTDVDDIIDPSSIIINRRSMADTKKYEVTGTPKQIASAINSINGNGVVIEDGAEIKEN